jgi:DNA-binding NarL/FixJ family response regulator
VEALRAGASGFGGKGTEPEALIQAVHTVHAGEALLSPVATTLLVDRYALAALAALAGRTRSTPAAGLDQLTDREREVLVRLSLRGSPTPRSAASSSFPPQRPRPT